MPKDKSKKTPDKTKAQNKKPSKDKEFTEVVKLMANTPPISNKELIEQSKKRRK